MTTININIRDRSPQDIVEIYEGNNKSFRQSAKCCLCDGKTFAKYHRNAIINLNNSRRINNNKSIKSDIFLDPAKCRVAILDIETSGLRSDFAMIICAVIKQYGTDYIKTFSLDLESQDLIASERKMIQEINSELNNFDGIATYFGTRFDSSFLRTRAFFHGLEPLRRIHHLDLYYTVRNSTNPSTRRLDRINQILQHANPDDSPSKTTLGFTEWMRVLNARDTSAMSYILDHCIKDVQILENAINKFRAFIPERIIRK